MLKFEIVSSRTVEGFENEKKFVAYMVQARQATESRVLDPDPANVERRYTHFLDLYNGLKKEFPALLSNISFPRKVRKQKISSLLLNLFMSHVHCFEISEVGVFGEVIVFLHTTILQLNFYLKNSTW